MHPRSGGLAGGILSVDAETPAPSDVDPAELTFAVEEMAPAQVALLRTGCHVTFNILRRRCDRGRYQSVSKIVHAVFKLCFEAALHVVQGPTGRHR